MSNGININIVKRTGQKEELNIDKIHKVVEFACEGLAGVSSSQIEMNANIQFYDEMSTDEIQEILIKSANDLINLDAPNYQYAAARLLSYAVYKQVFGGYDKIITLKEYDDLIKYLSKSNTYDKEYIMFLILRYYPIRNEVGSFYYIKNTDYVKLDQLTKQSNNWIVEKSKSIEMIRYKFKTAKFYVNDLPFITTIEQPVKTAIKKYVKDNTIVSNTPLFPIQDKPMTENQVSHRLAFVSGKYLPVKISTSTIFKILACDVVKNNSNDEARKLLTHYGKIRGTNITQIIEYYVNGNKIIQDDMSDISND